MIVVYPYRNDGNNGYELRYAIRSMVKHFYLLSGVCVIGDQPSWYKGEHIYAKDDPARKEYNIVAKVIASPHSKFLLSSDDVYARKDFDDVPYYYSGLLKDTRRKGRYALRVNNTASIYPEGKMFDIHYPMLINLDEFKEAHTLNWKNREYLCKSIYANFIGVTGEVAPDCKIRSKAIPDLPFFSTNSTTVKSVDLEKMYPDKSEYEY